jgi:hypothetical protein
VVVSGVVSFCCLDEVGFGFRKGSSITIGLLGLLPIAVNATLVSFEVQLCRLSASINIYLVCPAYLAVLSLLNGLLEWLQIVFRLLCRLDHSCVHHVDLLHQVLLQIFIFLSHSDCAGHRAIWCLDSLVAMIVLPSSNNGSIEYFELVDQPMLVVENGDPRIPPCFRSLNDLFMALASKYLLGANELSIHVALEPRPLTRVNN